MVWSTERVSCGDAGEFGSVLAACADKWLAGVVVVVGVVAAVVDPATAGVIAVLGVAVVMDAGLVVALPLSCESSAELGLLGCVAGTRADDGWC